MKSIEHDDTTQRPSYRRNEGLHFRIDKPSRRIVGLPFTLAVIEKNVTFITSYIVTPSRNFETITQPAEPWSIPGTDRPPSHPSEEAEWTQKVITGDSLANPVSARAAQTS
ncbi:hypothetical protein CDAR_451951 [Caerostris darwini]|uniref:Uncharacterized protein n=1 Tax=Caerostris darwini TaxID=1538125 RepID=A0AAV4WVU8_9ARAC|nr:hypothetical protein CDAR_451951 [Caerostris darwini]